MCCDLMYIQPNFKPGKITFSVLKNVTLLAQGGIDLDRNDEAIENLLNPEDQEDVTLNDISKFLRKLGEKLLQCDTDEISTIYREIEKVQYVQFTSQFMILTSVEVGQDHCIDAETYATKNRCKPNYCSTLIILPQLLRSWERSSNVFHLFFSLNPHFFLSLSPYLSIYYSPFSYLFLYLSRS